MILPSQIIKQISENPTNGQPLIWPFDDLNLRASSYDLTVGEEYYVSGDAVSSTLSTKSLKPRQTVTIPPHAVCFILVTETINLPADITAKVSLRMPHIYAGMILSSQPPFDPCYQGRVIVMLHNLSSTPFHLKAGDRLATIEFTRVEQKVISAKQQRPVRSIEEQLPKPLVSSLVEIANMSASALEKVSWLSSQMLVFAALIVAVLAVPGFFSYSNLLDRFSEQKEELKEMTKTLESYKRELEQHTRDTDDLEKRLVVMVQHNIAQRTDVPTPRSAAKSEVHK